MNRTRLTPCFHPTTTQSVRRDKQTPDVAIPAGDSDPKASNSQPAAQNRKHAIPRVRLSDLTADELANLERTCPLFTSFDHLPKGTRSYHRQQAQRRHEAAGLPEPDDQLTAALSEIARKRHELACRTHQATLDFAAVSSLPRTSHKKASVHTRTSTKAGTCKNTINLKHLQEWVKGSGVDEDLTQLNLRLIDGDSVYRLLRPLGVRYEAKDRERLRDVLWGGWFCPTLSLQGETKTSWGCDKPDQPRPGFKKDPETGRYSRRSTTTGNRSR